MGVAQTIILIGPPGSGKGTQADLLVQHLGAIHLSSGQVLRERASAEVLAEMTQGELVREGEVDRILEESLREADQAKSWLLDGYIRLEQDRNWLQGALAELGRRIDLVIFINATEDVCKKRIMSRGRADDTEEAWVERWSQYVATTVPVIQGLRALPFLEVNGADEPEILFEKIKVYIRKMAV